MAIKHTMGIDRRIEKVLLIHTHSRCIYGWRKAQEAKQNQNVVGICCFLSVLMSFLPFPLLCLLFSGLHYGPWWCIVYNPKIGTAKVKSFIQPYRRNIIQNKDTHTHKFILYFNRINPYGCKTYARINNQRYATSAYE